MNNTLQAALGMSASTVTNQIRTDHTHVLATFHRYEINTSPGTKKALVNTICLALEVHAQLEEEIFYPAMRATGVDASTVEKSLPEHAEIKRQIAELRSMSATDGAFDSAVMGLMRNVMHHVADEETVLLPDAERLLGDRLEALGAEMAARRLELVKPELGAIAWNTARAVPASTLAISVGAVFIGGALLRRLMRPARHLRD